MQKNINFISINDVIVDRASYVDPQGFLFHFENKIYRCIKQNYVCFFKSIIEDGLIDNLVKDFNLVPTKLSNIKLKEFPEALILEHQKIWPLSYPMEWCPSMLYDAAKITINLQKYLLSKGLALQDAYPWNIIFDGSEVIFVDLTSISSINKKYLWGAHEQFESFFIRPLILAQQGKWFAVKGLMYDYINGISFQQFYKLLSFWYKLKTPSLLIKLKIEQFLQKTTERKEYIRKLSSQNIQISSDTIRIRFIEKICKKLEKCCPVSIKDSWNNYYNEIDKNFNTQKKIDVINRQIKSSDFKTLLDIGCNTGVFSIEAAKLGIKVVSIDSSETCIEKLYNLAKDQHLNITPLISDITSPTPSYGYMSKQFPSLLQRIKSDCVLFLGLMHHIHISGRQPFEKIAELLNEVADKCLIFEFIDIEDANIPHLPEVRNINYTENSVKECLGKYFQYIQVQDSDRDTRKIFICLR